LNISLKKLSSDNFALDNFLFSALYIACINFEHWLHNCRNYTENVDAYDEVYEICKIKYILLYADSIII